MRYQLLAGVGIVVAMSLSACGSAPSHANITAPPPPAAPPPPPTTPPSTESFDTAEDKWSNAAQESGADVAWQHGATGKGVKIGFVDTGINTNNSEFAGKIDPASRDVAGDRPMEDLWGHGTKLSAIAAGARDGINMEGVAFDATIVMMKADAPGSCPENCSFDSDDIQDGVQAASAAGAKVINLSIGGDANSGVDDAVKQAVVKGAVVVVSAGNENASRPDDFARALANAGNGGVIIAGALGVDGASGVDYNQLSAISNRAGDWMYSYIGAPGYLVHDTGLNGGGDANSGTSFAAPVVAGAAALLIQAFPNLSPQEIAKLLFSTADDLGAEGVDQVYGWGRLNVGRAFQPQGETMLAGAAVPVSLTDNGTAPAAAGDALRRGTMNLVFLDSYSRAYSMNVARTIRAGESRSLVFSALANDVLAANDDVGPVDVAVAVDGHRMSLMDFNSPRRINFENEVEPRLLAAAATTRLFGATSLGVGYSSSAKSLERRLDAHGFTAATITPDVSTDLGFAARSKGAFAVRQPIGSFGFSISGEHGDTLSRTIKGRSPRYRLASISVDRLIAGSFLQVGLTHLRERSTVLGGSLSPLFGRPGASTLFLDASASRKLGSRFSITGSVRRSWTHFAAGQFASSAYALELDRENAWMPGDAFAFRLSQPLVVERGGLNTRLPSAYDYSTGLTTLAPAFVSLSPSAREVDAEAIYSLKVGAAHIGANAFLRVHPGHDGTARPDLGGAIRLRMRL